MKPGHGEVLLTEGDPDLEHDEERLVEEFRRQLDEVGQEERQKQEGRAPHP